MKLPILFQSLDRLQGQERCSKLLHKESELYALLHALKSEIKSSYEVAADRMDLHIEITKDKEDGSFNEKAASLDGKEISLLQRENWGFMGKAFVLWTPEAPAYGRTHITIVYFGEHPKPALSTLHALTEGLLVQ
jgi:hypothetical protein